MACTASGDVFSYSVVPSALAAVAGLDTLAATGGTRLQASIFVGILLAAVLLVGALLSARRGVAAAIALIAYGALGVVLGLRRSEFGLFKLYMYTQPFIAAAVAVWLSGARSRRALAIAGSALAVLVAAQLRAQQDYVRSSRDPLDLPNASAQALLPRFQALATQTAEPVVSVTDNPTLAKLEAVSVGDKPVYFISRNVFAPLLRGPSHSRDRAVGIEARHGLASSGWQRRAFVLHAQAGPRSDSFLDDTRASGVLGAAAVSSS